METTIQLAPAAGAGIGKLVADALLADPAFIPAMKAAFLGGLTAEMHYYDREAKCWQNKPDYRTRIQAVTQCLAHMEGMPIQRIIKESIGAGREIDPEAALLDSPELLARLEERLAVVRRKANWKHSGQQAHKRPIKVVAEPSPSTDASA